MNRPVVIIAIGTLTLLVLMILVALYQKMKSKQAVNHPNVQAFLKVVRFAEGTDGPNGYRTMYGGTRSNPKLFDNGFKDHPRINNCAMSGGKQLCSTAAGAYQFLKKTWDYLRVKLQLSDFSPANQDLAAVELIREKGALELVKSGYFSTAINKVNTVWASLPGSPYGQPTKSLAALMEVYKNSGGNYA